MNRENLLMVLKDRLSSMTLEDFSHLFINDVMAIEEFFKLCNGVSAGKTISLLFNPHRLSTDTEKDDLSVYESLNVEDKLNGLARLYLYNLEHGTNNAFYSAIQRGYQNIQYVNEFPPFVARSIILDFCGSKQFVDVLDPCAGWGGRMIGCASIANVNYTACEPSTKTFNGLQSLGNWLSALQPTFTFTVNHVPYEEFETDKKFDIALTSPPYYNTEHYSDEETNSLNRYKTFEDWIEGFYRPLILNTMCRLRDGGVFIINVGDRKYELTKWLFNICESAGFFCERIKDYLSGNGDNKEKFFCISKKPKFAIKRKLF